MKQRFAKRNPLNCYCDIIPGNPAESINQMNDLGYFMHAEGHGALPADYEFFIKFIKIHFFK